MWVVDRVHSCSTYLRAPAEPAAAACLTNSNILMIDIADLAYCGAAIDMHHADLAGGKAHLGVCLIAGHQLRCRTGAAHHLAAPTDVQLYVVYLGTERDAAQRQSIAYLYLGLVTRHNAVADLQAQGREDVALLTIGVEDQGDASRAVGIVLDGRDLT